VTAPKLYQFKQEGRKIVCITAYDTTSASLAEAAGVDVILVGDSAANVLFGESTTLPLSLETMATMVRSVSRAAHRSFVVADMPFGTYGASLDQTVKHAVMLMKSGAQAVKIEGCLEEEIWALGRIGIPVMGHLGMTPQSIHNFGGFRVQGRGEEGSLIAEQAQRIQDAGVFAMVLELIPQELATSISKQLDIPTIGIGAGPGCDGQIQVWHDLLGLQEEEYRHAKRYCNLRETILSALGEYSEEVRHSKFPTSENSF